MPVCTVCGRSFEVGGYHVAVDGRQYDSVECALRAEAARGRTTDPVAEWIAAARLRLALDRPASESESRAAERP